MTLALAAPHVQAQVFSATLKHIQDSQTVNIGFREGVPFSWTDSTGKVTGYTIALCDRIATRLGQTVGIKNIAIRYVLVNLSERVPALNSRKIDMDCGVNADAPERHGSVMFTQDYYIADMRIITLQSSGVRTLNDLKGKTVSIVSGSKDLLEANRVNREQHLNLSFRATPTIQDAFNLMAQRRTAALLLDDIVVYPLINDSQHPADFAVSRVSIGPRMHYAIMLKKGDPQFAALVDTSLNRILSSPVHVQLSKKWLTSGTVQR